MSGCTEAQPTEITEDTIRSMAEVLVRRFHPKRIILFGSCAHGTQTPDSDVDLLIVTEQEDAEAIGESVQMRTALSPFLVPKDIVVLPAGRFAAEAAKPWTVVHEAAHEGRILYERD